MTATIKPKLMHAITGKTADAGRQTITSTVNTAQRCCLVRQQHFGKTPYIYEERGPDGKPTGWWPSVNGGSLFANRWRIWDHIDAIKPSLLGGPDGVWAQEIDSDGHITATVVADVEAFCPTARQTELDCSQQYKLMLAHAVTALGCSSGEPVALRLRDYFECTALEAKSYLGKGRFGFYGMSSHRDGDLPTWLADLIDFTAPCLYRTPGKTFAEYAADIKARVERSRHEAPGKPVIAFICWFEEGTNRILSPEEFSVQLTAGADEYVLWGDIPNTSFFTQKWLPALSAHEKAMKAVFA